MPGDVQLDTLFSEKALSRMATGGDLRRHRFLTRNTGGPCGRPFEDDTVSRCLERDTEKAPCHPDGWGRLFGSDAGIDVQRAV